MRKLIYLIGLLGLGAALAVLTTRPLTSPPTSDDVRAEGHVFAPGEPILQNGLQMTLTEAKFSITRSAFWLEIRYSGYTGDGDKAPAFVDAEMINLTGVTDVRPVRITNAGRPDAQTMTYVIEAGAPLAADSPVDLTIDHVLLWTGQSALTEHGPWSFQALPAESTYDMSGWVQDLGLVFEEGGITVVLDQVWASPSETLLVYTLSAPAGFLGPAGAPVRMLLPDGSVVRGLPLESDPEGTGKRVVALPPLPTGTSELRVDFGPYLLETAGGPMEINLPQASNSVTLSGRELILNQPIETSAGAAQIVKVASQNDMFSIDIAAGASETGFAGSPADATVVATDDKGHIYRPVSASAIFTKDSTGRPSFATQRYVFAGPLEATANSLSVSISSFAELIEGPWSSSITLTK